MCQNNPRKTGSRPELFLRDAFTIAHQGGINNVAQSREAEQLPCLQPPSPSPFIFSAAAPSSAARRHLPENLMSVRGEAKAGGRCRVCCFFLRFILIPSSSVPIDAVVSPSAYPLLIHPTQRAENGCKCISLKGPSHQSDGRG